ncbi:amidohydrolase [Microvirga sp. W0021]|uniref:Amidohydrolase n=1 Tax=Hohaiivirga grylli TaxID=3133970 RepID=A0ABV0BJ48_9HYPH
MKQELKQAIAAVEQDVIAWRRHMHMHPELTFHELETAKYIYGQLSELKNLELKQLTPNSVQALLKGGKPGKRIALRADIDALPVTEDSGEPFSSTKPGVMHACGHDSHAAMLMGAAKVLSQMQDQIAGEVLFIFQHAEEVPPGGAQDLVDLGVLDGVDMIFGLHVFPNIPTGEVMLKEGVFCASSDNFDITIKGCGAHGSMPHLSIDPIAVGSEFVSAVQSVVSRRLDPLLAPVVTVATFQAGDSYNVIPSTAKLAGTIRTHDKAVREKAPKLFEQTLAGICAAYGAEYELEWTRGYAVGVNTKDACDIATDVIATYLEDTEFKTMPAPMFGAEDFSAYLEKVPGCFIFVGSRNEKIGAVHGLHNPQFKLDEEAMKTGVSMHVSLIHKLLMS